MEGQHFALGPWFTVQEEGETRRLGSFFISDGTNTEPAYLELRMELCHAPERLATHTETRHPQDSRTSPER